MIIPALIVIAELIWQAFIKYPPTPEQINLGLTGPAGLWLVRLLSLGLILSAVFFISGTISGNIRKYFRIVLLMSPVISLLWMSYPLDCLKIFIVTAVFALLVKFRRPAWLVAAMCAVTVLFLNLVLFNQRPLVLETLSLSASQSEVTARMTLEDSIKPNIHVPLFIRRIGYNKYYLTLKNLANQSLPFFDLETLFFQEVHPLGQKASVMFFWPEIYILLAAVWFLVRKSSPDTRWIPSLLIISFVYFLTQNASADRRLAFVLLPLAIVIACGIDRAMTSGSKLIKVCMVMLVLAASYGWLTNYYDRYTRPPYWLDNRPLAYHFIFTHLQTMNIAKYKSIFLPDTLSAADAYCRYYLNSCPLITYKNFNLSVDAPESNALYIGFIGNFLGPRVENDFPSDYGNNIANQRVNILSKTQVYDNIANGYGRDLLVTESR